MYIIKVIKFIKFLFKFPYREQWWTPASNKEVAPSGLKQTPPQADLRHVLICSAVAEHSGCAKPCSGCWPVAANDPGGLPAY